MSELKDYSILDIEAIDDERFKKESAPGKWVMESRVYLKSEADKVIADLDESHKMEVEQLLMEIAELKADYNEACDRLQTATRHQKYKRCLAMAMFCEERYNYLTCLENWQMTDKEYQQVIGDYWDRWHKHWLKIAEKFKDKEAK